MSTRTKTRLPRATKKTRLQQAVDHANRFRESRRLDETDLPFVVTREWLVACGTSGIGWSRLQLSVLGVEWPLVSGWKERLIGLRISEEIRLTFERRGKAEVSAVAGAELFSGIA